MRRFHVPLELGLITLWSVWVGRGFLNLDARVLPQGREFGLAIMSHAAWANLGRCGACVWWNGLVNGGNPTFVDLHGAVLHPVVVVSTLLFGMIDGGKIVFVVSLAMGGIAQWWLARAIGLHWPARLWGGALAVVGGNLLGRMDVGIVGVPLATAACSLAVAAGLDLALNSGRRTVVVLAIMLALACLAGQGYLQLGLLFGILPVFALMSWPNRRLRRDLVLACGLALLLAAPLLVPLVHFWPNFTKLSDPSLQTAQPLIYLPLNLVIGDASFYRIENVLGRGAYPWLYVNFIGWTPIVLCMVALRLVPRHRLRLLLFFLIATGLIFLLASGIILRLLALLSSDMAGMIRYPSLIAGLAVPLILAVAAWGLELLLIQIAAIVHGEVVLRPFRTITFPRWLSGGRVRLFSIRLLYSLIALWLIWSVAGVYNANKIWIGLTTQRGDVQRSVTVLKALGMRWIEPPYGEYGWQLRALADGLKLTNVIRPWSWRSRELPPGSNLATYESYAQPGARLMQHIESIFIFIRPSVHYAYVTNGIQKISCQSSGYGGNIDIVCDTDTAGTLLVQENSWSGWSVRRDGHAGTLLPGQWLRTAAPAGHHIYAFRYRPWDAPLGLTLMAVGIGWCAWLWAGSIQPRRYA